MPSEASKKKTEEEKLKKDAERRRAVVKDVLFPYLLEMDDNIEYTKVFLQAFSGLVNGIFDERRKVTKILHLEPQLMAKLKDIFNVEDPAQRREYDRYLGLVKKIRDISVQDISYGLELPRYIDGMITKKAGKESIKTIDIDAILG